MALSGCVTTPRPAPRQLLYLDERVIVDQASKVVRKAYSGIWLSDYKLTRIIVIKDAAPMPDYVSMERGSDFTVEDTIYLADLPDPPPVRIQVFWIGRNPIELKKGKIRALDRKKVEKIKVEMTADGRVLEIEKSAVWLGRKHMANDAGPPRGETPPSE